MAFVRSATANGTGLTRLHPGDWLIYYSSRESLDSRIPVQAFTAIGTVLDEEIWQAEEGEFKPWRRKVDYQSEAEEAPIRPLLERLSFTAGRRN